MCVAAHTGPHEGLKRATRSTRVEILLYSTVDSPIDTEKNLAGAETVHFEITLLTISL